MKEAPIRRRRSGRVRREEARSRLTLPANRRAQRACLKLCSPTRRSGEGRKASLCYQPLLFGFVVVVDGEHAQSPPLPLKTRPTAQGEPRGGASTSVDGKQCINTCGLHVNRRGYEHPRSTDRSPTEAVPGGLTGGASAAMRPERATLQQLRAGHKDHGRGRRDRLCPGAGVGYTRNRCRARNGDSADAARKSALEGGRRGRYSPSTRGRPRPSYARSGRRIRQFGPLCIHYAKSRRPERRQPRCAS